MNAANNPRVYVRSMATRRAHLATSAAVKDALTTLRISGYDLVILETAGIGQGDEVTGSNVSVYVMTPNTVCQASSKKSTCWTLRPSITRQKRRPRRAARSRENVPKKPGTV